MMQKLLTEDGLNGQSGVVVTLISVLMATLQEVGRVVAHPLKMVVKTVQDPVLILHHATTTAAQVIIILLCIVHYFVNNQSVECYFCLLYLY